MASAANINVPNAKGRTKLINAVMKNKLVEVNNLLAAGADVNIGKTDNGATPLNLASELGYLEIVQALLAKGADINKADVDGFTPLAIASYYNKLNIVQALVSAGADMNKGTLKSSATPLLIASEKGYLEIVKALLAAGADINKSLIPSGTTSFYIASEKGYLEIVKALLAAGADVNKGRTDIGATPLFIASQFNRLEVVKALLAAGADVNKGRTDIEATPLYVASEEGYLEVVKALLAAGADVNKGKTDTGSTPLFTASQFNNLDVVKTLLEVGADINIPSFKGKSVLQYAEEDKFKPEINKYILIKAGKVWKGWTQSDAEKFDTIFAEEPDATGKILADDYACCPVCLKYVERSEACMYMKHKCPELGGYYNKDLYKKYKNPEGFIGWCTICGRCAIGHRHFTLAPFNSDVPPLLKGGDPFEKNCSLTNGGGGRDEKIARFRSLRETARELQEEVDKMTEREAMDILVQETWNGPFTKKYKIPGIKASKQWNIKSKNFPANVVAAEAPVEAAVAPNIPLPNTNPKVEEVNEPIDNLFGNEAEVGLLFKHTQPNGSKQEHKIAYETLINHLTKQNEEWGAANFGRCFMYSECKCFLYPKEIEDVVGKEGLTQELFDTYKQKFNSKFAGGFPPQGGRRRLRKTRKQKKQTKQKGGGTTFFTEATNAVCVNPKLEGGRRRLRRKTKKAKRERKNKSRKH